MITLIDTLDIKPNSARNKDMAGYNFMMVAIIKDNGKTTKCKDMAKCIIHKEKSLIKDCGKMDVLTALERFLMTRPRTFKAPLITTILLRSRIIGKAIKGKFTMTPSMVREPSNLLMVNILLVSLIMI